MKTVEELAKQNGVSSRTIQRRLKAYKDQTGQNIGVGEKSPVSGEVEKWLNLSDQGQKSQPEKSTLPPSFKGAPTRSNPKRLRVERLSTLGVVLVRIAVAALGVRASYGVFVFAASLVPFPFALTEAFSLELTYIGITFLRLDDKGQKWALGVALGAMAISILYNILAAAVLKQPDIFDSLSPAGFWLVTVLHGAPMAGLAFLVSWFIVQHIKI